MTAGLLLASAFYWLATLQASQEGAVFHAGTSRRFSDGYVFACNKNPAACPPVLRLLASWNPSHVPRCVRAVVVHALKRVPGRAWTNVAEKRLKVYGPGWIHVDPAGAVIAKPRVLGICATLLRCRPRVVLASVSVAVHKVASTAKTAAPLSVASSQHIEANRLFVAAIAATEPQRSFPGSASAPNGNEFPESSAAQINDAHRLRILPALSST